MDNRFSRRWSSLPTDKDVAPQPVQRAASTPNVTFSKPSITSYSPSKPVATANRNSHQRWSTIRTSSLATQVETIEYDIEESPAPLSSNEKGLKRSKSIVNIRIVMRQLFSSKKERDEAPPLPPKPDNVTKPSMTRPAMVKMRSLRSKKSEPALAEAIPEKEQHLWSRLSVVVRPPKSVSPTSRPSLPPKRIDSGVDVQNLKSALKKRDDAALSTTSLPSLPLRERTPSVTTSVTITGTPILLTLAERNHIVSELQKMQQMVRHHSLEAEAFSKNLAGLLWDKEHYIVANKRLTAEMKKQMCEQMEKVRETTAKTFARKGAFYDRSLDVIERILNDLGVRSLKNMAAHNGSTSSLRSISPDSTLSTALTLTNEPTSQTSSESERDGTEKREYQLTLRQLRTAMQTLKADLTGHSHLDPALRNGVVKPANERKYPTSENEMVAMKRFVRFVDGRVKKLGEGYWEMGRWVRSLESWVDDLEESGC